MGHYPRIREITDSLGAQLRVSLEPHPSCGAMITLQRLDQSHRPRTFLDGLGAEVLLGFIMSARIALPASMPDEAVEGAFPVHMCLQHQPKVTIAIVQQSNGRTLEIPAPFWDRLCAELMLIIPFARFLALRAGVRIQ